MSDGQQGGGREPADILANLSDSIKLAEQMTKSGKLNKSELLGFPIRKNRPDEICIAAILAMRFADCSPIARDFSKFPGLTRR